MYVGVPTPPPPPGRPAADRPPRRPQGLGQPRGPKAQCQLDRKQQRALELEQLLPYLLAQGYHLVFTDGSSKTAAGIGRVAGCGIFSPALLSVSAYVPVHLKQTNNIVDLFATLRAIELLPPGRYAFCSNSSYAILVAAEQQNVGSYAVGKDPVAQSPTSAFGSNFSMNLATREKPLNESKSQYSVHHELHTGHGCLHAFLWLGRYIGIDLYRSMIHKLDSTCSGYATLDAFPNSVHIPCTRNGGAPQPRRGHMQLCENLWING